MLLTIKRSSHYEIIIFHLIFDDFEISYAFQHKKQNPKCLFDFLYICDWNEIKKHKIYFSDVSKLKLIKNEENMFVKCVSLFYNWKIF